MNPNRDFTDEDIRVFMRCYNSKSNECIKNYELYGPSNPLICEALEGDDELKCPYSEDGICYMLTCNCKENEDDDSKFKSYYTGICQECKQVLPSKVDVWRTPLIGGGFVGCFCRSHFRIVNENNEDLEEENIVDTFTNLCDIMEIVRDKHPVLDYSQYNTDEIENVEDYF
jgi:hypothetical protein